MYDDVRRGGGGSVHYNNVDVILCTPSNAVHKIFIHIARIIYSYTILGIYFFGNIIIIWREKSEQLRWGVKKKHHRRHRLFIASSSLRSALLHQFNKYTI